MFANRLTVLFLLIAGVSSRTGVVAAEVDFNRDIKPILSNQCYFCHGPDADERQGGIDGLRLDTADGAVDDLGGYQAIVPGDATASVLIDRITSTDEYEAMPPPGTGRRLTEAEVELIRQWIDAGANYDAHWSYVPPQRPDLPTVSDPTWPLNPIDHFILARLDREQLTVNEPADRYALIRRLHLDLIGLPPSLSEVDSFVNDPDPSAYEKLVDELLSRNAYGEHWARMWLDLARYADSAGYADDPARTIWLYRDYVIDAINSNKPFDRFTIEQIAGDLLPDPDDEQLIATAFHRNTLTNNEGGTDDEEFRNAAVVDRVNTTLAVWMGTTMACAQCHTHKYDPITQEEYFRVFAILNNTADADRRDESPLHAVYTADQQRRRDELSAELERLEPILTTPTPELAAAQEAWEAAFPRDLTWETLEPTAAESLQSAELAIDGPIVTAAAGPATDTYRLTLPLGDAPIRLRALRLEALTADSLPNHGPGHAGGNFVITSVASVWTPPDAAPPNARYVRIEIPGRQQILSLAEVEVFVGETNIALAGKASQSSTAYEGPARLAIDGNRDGRYADAKSTTHTEVSDDPWWELDLLSEQPVDRLVIWNRTDAGTVKRLRNARITLLDDDREPVWQQEIAEPPNPSIELSPGGPRSIRFVDAVADYSQAGFQPTTVLDNPDPKTQGWAVGGATGKPHQLVLLTDEPVEFPPGGELTVTIEQKSRHAQHTLGRFQLSLTDDARVQTWAETPRDVVSALVTAQADRTESQVTRLGDYYRGIAPLLEPIRREVAQLEQRLAAIKPVTVPVMSELSGDQRRVTRLQHRGNFMSLGDQVDPGTPAAFHPLPSDRPADRLALANWLVDDANPLTARVIANRYWEKLFGTGLVATSEDFGAQGEMPSHPELLDWLATELRRLDWDTKAFVKMLVMSASYRQSSRIDPESYERDPENRLLARGPRFRIAAETIRDQALAVAGLLSGRMHGSPVNPPQPSIGLNAAFGSGIDWKTSEGADRYRRGLYTMWRRSNPYPSMATFDAPNREVCTLRRGRSNTPLQALVTLNDPVFVEAAQGLARRMIAAAGDDRHAAIVHGFRLCLARFPDESELQRLLELHDRAAEVLACDPEEAEKLATDPLGPPPAGIDVIDLATWTAVANVLLNLDETLMRR